jgi:hypothetical protein
MKLADLQRKLRAEVAPPDPRLGRHPSGALYLGIDPATPGSDRTSIAVFRRDSRGALWIVEADEARTLGKLSQTKDNLASETITLAPKYAMGAHETKKLGQSLLWRFMDLYERRWQDRESVPDATLKKLFGDAEHEETTLGRAIRNESGSVIGHVAGEKVKTRWLIYAPRAHSVPILFRYVGLGVKQGFPVVYVQGVNPDADGAEPAAVCLGHGDAFYPAETLACTTCEKTGEVSVGALVVAADPDQESPTERCPTCDGLSRLWKHRPAAMEGGAECEPETFAEAYPSRWAPPAAPPIRR